MSRTLAEIPAYVLGQGILGAGERGRFREWLDEVRAELLTAAARCEFDEVTLHLKRAAQELLVVQGIIDRRGVKP